MFQISKNSAFKPWNKYMYLYYETVDENSKLINQKNKLKK